MAPRTLTATVGVGVPGPLLATARSSAARCTTLTVARDCGDALFEELSSGLSRGAADPGEHRRKPCWSSTRSRGGRARLLARFALGDRIVCHDCVAEAPRTLAARAHGPPRSMPPALAGRCDQPPPTLDGDPPRARAVVRRALIGMLRPLLENIAEDPAAASLAREGGQRVRVASHCGRSCSRACSTGPPTRSPRTARRSSSPATTGSPVTSRSTSPRGCAPRPVRFYPSRGVAYESHLAPPAHLVGLRVAALDALLEERDPGADAPVVVVSAVALSEKVPDPSLRPRSFRIPVGELVDLDELARDLVAAGYENVDQVEDRGQFALRGGLLDVYPATEDRAVPGRPVRRRGRVAALVLDVHPALAGRGRRASRSRRPPSSPRSTASWPSSPRSRRPRAARATSAPTSPSSCPSSSSARCWT